MSERETNFLKKIKIVLSVICPRCHSPLQLSECESDGRHGFCSNPACAPSDKFDEKKDRREGWAVSLPIPKDATIVECSRDELAALQKEACKLSCQGQTPS